jgi:DNA-binding beta-propeller fold protein YncE
MSVAARMLASSMAMTVVVTAARVPWSAAASAPPAAEWLTPMAIAVAGDRLYVADFDRDRIVVTTLTGEPVTSWGSTGSATGAFRGPAGIAVGPDRVVVADLDNHRIQTFTLDGEPLAAWPTGDAGSSPCGVALAPDGRIYATDIDAGVVRCWTADGTLLHAWSIAGGGALAEPWGIAVGEGGEVFVADHARHRIARYSAEGEPLGAWGTAGSGAGQLLGPMGVATAADGSIIVTDLVGTRVQRFSADGVPLSSWSLSPERPGLVSGVAVDASSDLFVADVSAGTVGRVAALAATVDPPALVAPTEFAVLAVMPLPSAGPTTLRMSIPSRGALRAEIYSVDGRRVAVVGPEAVEPGVRALTWGARTDRGEPVGAGVYFARLALDTAAGRITRNARLVVVR